MNLNKLLEKHKKLELPSFPEDDEFSGWIADLIEIDSYYFGLAVSYLHGDRKDINLNYLEDAKISLKKFERMEEDSEIYEACLKYIQSLENIVSELS